MRQELHRELDIAQPRPPRIPHVPIVASDWPDEVIERDPNCACIFGPDLQCPVHGEVLRAERKRWGKAAKRMLRR